MASLSARKTLDTNINQRLSILTDTLGQASVLNIQTHVYTYSEHAPRYSRISAYSPLWEIILLVSTSVLKLPVDIRRLVELAGTPGLLVLDRVES